MTEKSEEALAALSAHIGLPLEFRDGSCAFLIDAQPFTIRSDEEYERIVVSALIADDLPERPSREFVADLLNLGFGLMLEGLPAVAREPELGFISAFVSFPLATLSAEEFPEKFDKFAEFAMTLTHRFETESQNAPEPSDAYPPTHFDGLMV